MAHACVLHTHWARAYFRLAFPSPRITMIGMCSPRSSTRTKGSRRPLSMYSRALALTARRGPEPSYQNVNVGYNLFKYDKPFQFKIRENPNHGVLEGLDVAYETWGTLNESKTNAILLHTGLSASSHAASHAVCEVYIFASLSCRKILLQAGGKSLWVPGLQSIQQSSLSSAAMS